MKTLNSIKNSTISILKYLLAPKGDLSSKEKITRIKGELIVIYLVAIRLYYVIYN
jgi:hypothetical protein